LCYNNVMNGNTVTSESRVTDFQQSQRQTRDLLRKSILDTASQLLASEGTQALSMRRVSTAINASTSVLYTMFQSKDGLANALYLEGFERFGQALKNSVKTKKHLSALQRLEKICFAYREFALEQPTYYKAMFLGAIPQFVLHPQTVAKGWISLQILEDTVQECQAENLIFTADTRATAKAIWAMGHGAVSLELMGSFLELNERQLVYEILVRTIIQGLQIAPKRK
jgi:AcrR family transcriptional regulator